MSSMSSVETVKLKRKKTYSPNSNVWLASLTIYIKRFSKAKVTLTKTVSCKFMMKLIVIVQQ